MHLAVVFGRTSVVRYLAGRFPETIQTTDDNGRTPLHYAATLPDNGHYYNLLVHLGADASAKDNVSCHRKMHLDLLNVIVFNSLVETQHFT